MLCYVMLCYVMLCYEPPLPGGKDISAPVSITFCLIIKLLLLVNVVAKQASLTDGQPEATPGSPSSPRGNMGTTERLGPTAGSPSACFLGCIPKSQEDKQHGDATPPASIALPAPHGPGPPCLCCEPCIPNLADPDPNLPAKFSNFNLGGGRGRVTDFIPGEWVHR